MRAGLLAEFATQEDLLAAVSTLRETGYRDLDAYTPYPIKGLEQALGLRRSPLTWIVFPIAAAGTLGAYLIMWYCNAVSFPINVGGRPNNAVLAFVPIMFETTVLAAAVSAFLLVFVLCSLPQLNAPEFDVEGFESAGIDRFWLGVDAGDGHFDGERTSDELRRLGASRIARFGAAS